MFRKAFSILELEERKDRRVVKQDFQCYMFFFFCLFLRLCSFWYGMKALHPAKVNGQSW